MANNERINPSTSDKNRLVADSAGYCAIDMKPLVHEDAIMTGEFAHIKAVKPGGARYDKNMTEKDRSKYENFIFICPNCHKLIDSKDYIDDWPVDRLVQLKEAHKDKMSKLYTTFINVNDGVTYTRPTHMEYYFLVAQIKITDQLYKDNIENTRSDFNKLIDVLKNVPPNIRSFYYQMIKLSDDKSTIKIYEVFHNLTIGKTLMFEYQSILERKGLCFYREEDDEFGFGVRIEGIEDGELIHYIAITEKPGVNVLEESLINLDFSWAD